MVSFPQWAGFFFLIILCSSGRPPLLFLTKNIHRSPSTSISDAGKNSSHTKVPKQTYYFFSSPTLRHPLAAPSTPPTRPRPSAILPAAACSRRRQHRRERHRTRAARATVCSGVAAGRWLVLGGPTGNAKSHAIIMAGGTDRMRGGPLCNWTHDGCDKHGKNKGKKTPAQRRKKNLCAN